MCALTGNLPKQLDRVSVKPWWNANKKKIEKLIETLPPVDSNPRRDLWLAMLSSMLPDRQSLAMTEHYSGSAGANGIFPQDSSCCLHTIFEKEGAMNHQSPTDCNWDRNSGEHCSW